MEPFCNFSINPKIDFNSFVNKDFGYQKEGFFKEFFQTRNDVNFVKETNTSLSFDNWFVVSNDDKFKNQILINLKVKNKGYFTNTHISK